MATMFSKENFIKIISCQFILTTFEDAKINLPAPGNMEIKTTLKKSAKIEDQSVCECSGGNYYYWAFCPFTDEL